MSLRQPEARRTRSGNSFGSPNRIRTRNPSVDSAPQLAEGSESPALGFLSSGAAIRGAKRRSVPSLICSSSTGSYALSLAIEKDGSMLPAFVQQSNWRTCLDFSREGGLLANVETGRPNVAGAPYPRRPPAGRD